MLSRNIFIGLLLFCIVALIGFYLFIYAPQEQEKIDINSELQATLKKFNKAKLAMSELQKVQAELIHQEEELNHFNARFIDKNQLKSITINIRNFTQKYNLKLLDFTPLFSTYFADTSTAPIKTLPFTVTVQGKFFDIGRYLENWERQDFFMIPDEIFVKEISSRTNVLEANITGRLYAWSNNQD